MHKKNSKDSNRKLEAVLPLVCLISVGGMIGFFAVSLMGRTLPVVRFLSANNIRMLFSAILLFGLLILLSRILFLRMKLCSWVNDFSVKPISSVCFWTTFVLLVACLIVLFLVRRFSAELTEYPNTAKGYAIHKVPSFLMIPILLVGTAIILLIYLKFHDSENLSGVMIYFVYAILLLLAFFNFLFLNVFSSSFDLHHGSAYIQPILNCRYYTQFTEKTVGVYGHYGIFYAALMLLFRLDAISIFYMIAVVGTLSLFFYLTIVHQLTENHMLRIISAVSGAYAVLLMTSTSYYQRHPHRVFPMMLTLAVLITLLKRGKVGLKSRLVLLFVCIFCLIWNSESGIFCTGAVCAGLILFDLQQYRWNSKEMLKSFLRVPFFVGFSFLGAVGTVNLYNYYCSKKLSVPMHFVSFREYLFPFFSKSYMVGTYSKTTKVYEKGTGVLPYDAVFGNHAWIFVMALFALLFIYALSKTTLFNASGSKKNGTLAFSGAVAVMGFGAISYYMNRAAYANLAIILELAVLAMTVFTDRFMDRRLLNNLERKTGFPFTLRSAMTSAWGFCCLAVMSALSFEVILFGDTALANKYAKKTWDRSYYDTYVNQYRGYIPQDGLAVGSLTEFFNFQTNQDSGIHLRDYSDFFITINDQKPMDDLVAMAEEKGYFIVWPMTLTDEKLERSLMTALPDFELVREEELGGYPIRYYERP